MQKSLVIMLKEPCAGRVKTRLGRDIGMTRAAWWFRHQTAQLIRRLNRDPRWRTYAALSPDNSLLSRCWPHDLRRLPQGRGDLGDRMGRVFRSMPKGPVLIIGGDIPGISPRLIETGFKALGSHDAVFGPAPDGGYWLVGLKGGSRPAPHQIFNQVRWSTRHALTDTINSLGPDQKIAKISTLQDVDTVADLALVKQNRPSPHD